MADNTPADTAETPVDAQTDAPPADAPADPVDGAGDEPDTFPREYVTKLRDENAKHRTRAQQTDELARRLHSEMVKGTRRLADPADLPFDEAHLTDPESLSAAIESLLQEKPHFAARRPVPGTNIGQGIQGDAPKQQANLIGALRSAHGWA